MACGLSEPALSKRVVANLACCSGAARVSRYPAAIHGSAANLNAMIADVAPRNPALSEPGLCVSAARALPVVSIARWEQIHALAAAARRRAHVYSTCIDREDGGTHSQREGFRVTPGALFGDEVSLVTKNRLDLGVLLW